MPLIPKNLLDSVVYVYPGPEADPETGGSGFILGSPSKIFPAELNLYVVTNAHVIANAIAPVLRLNRKGGGLVTCQAPKEHWWPHPRGADVAVFPFEPPEDAEWGAINTKTHLVGGDWVGELNIGPGDDVFMVGRYIGHDGRLTNTPSVRFGNISVMPIEKMLDPDGVEQESYLVEMRSMPGYSGSPVFVWKPPASLGPLKDRVYLGYLGPWLLGIDWGHPPSRAAIIDKLTGKVHPRWSVSVSGMAAVAPVERIVDVLDCKELQQQRQARDVMRVIKKASAIQYD